MIKESKIDFSKLTDENVKKALEAQQVEDLESWYSCFADKVTFINEEKETDFKAFFNRAFGYHEKMLDIEAVKENGLYVFGNYFGGVFGRFRIYLRFSKNAAGKFDRLERKQMSLTLNESWHQPAF